MRNALLILVLVILLSPLLPGCRGGNAMRMMDRADSLIVGEPTAALAILDDIPASSRSGGETEARYNMLRTEALYRALDDTILPDSAIAASVSYYTRKDDKANAARARYNLAMLRMQRGEYSSATVDLLISENDIADVPANHFLRGLIYRSLGYCFAEFYDMSTAITYQKRAYDEFISSGDSLYAGYVLAEIACRNYDVRNYSETELYADKAVDFAEKIDNKRLYVSAKLFTAACYVYNDKYREAISLYEDIHSIDSTCFAEKDYVNWGYAYILADDTESARRCNLHVRTLERAMNSIDVNLLLHEGRYKECSELMISTFDILDSVRNTVWTRNDVSIINDYYKTQQANSARTIQQEKHRRYSVIIISLLLLILSVVVYRLIVVSYKKRLANSMLQAETLQNAIEGRDSKLKKADSVKAELEGKITELKSRISIVSELNGKITEELKDTSSRLENSRKELRISRNELNTSQEKARDFQASIDELRAQLGLFQKELASVSAELDSSRVKLYDSQKALEEANSKGNSREELWERKFRETNTEVHKLLTSRFELVSTLLEERYNFEQNPHKDKRSEKATEKLNRKIKVELEKFVKNPDLISDLEKIINSTLDNLISRLRADYPDFNENYINMYMFSLLNFCPAAIATLQNSTLSTVYSRKSKLKYRLLKSENQAKFEYLRFLN